MAWVRYDDHFHDNHKVAAVIEDDPGAIALHALARTWTNSSPCPGYVPAYMPGRLISDKRKGAKWAAVLTRHGLFHVRGDECPRCQKRIAEAGWPVHEGGWVFHDWWQYNAPERERTVPGTPADISAKRREAGRNGGLKSAARREQTRRETRADDFGGEANQANQQAKDVSKTASLVASNGTKASNGQASGVTPEPVLAPNGASTGPEPVPPTAGFASNDEAKPLTVHERDDDGLDPAALVMSVTKRAEPITNAYYDKNPMCKWPAVNGIVIHALKTGRYADETIQAALLRLANEGRSVTIETLRLEIEGMPATRQASGGPPVTRRQEAINAQQQQSRAWAEELEAQMAGQLEGGGTG